MTYQPDDPRHPSRQMTIKERVIVRDDTKISGATILAALVAIMLVGGALVYVFSSDRDSTASVTAPTSEQSDATTGQGQRASTPQAR